MPHKKAAAAAHGLSAEEVTCLDSWSIEIAAKDLGDVNEEANGEWRVGGNRRLVIHRNGCWHDFLHEKTGHGALSLLTHLHHGDAQAALEVAQAWLTQHKGDGELGRASGDDEDDNGEDAQAIAADDAWHIAYVDTFWRRAEAIDGTPAEAYLKSRGLWPLPAGVDKWLQWAPNVRGDEGALLAAVADDSDEVVAVQLTYITPDGEKSKAQPVRRTLRGPHDWRSRGTFRIGAPGAPDLVLTEGVEDAIVALMAGAARAHACLGGGALGRARLPITVENVIVARDDDPPGSPACVALGRGVARLLGQGRKVSVTPRAGRLAPGAKDLNDLLRIDVALARRQLNEAGGIGPFDKVEREAMLDEISRLPQDVYENIRKSVARMLNWRAKALDGDWGKRRGRRALSGEDDPVTKAGRIEPWRDPVTDLGSVLDAAVAQLKRFLIVPSPTYLDTIALWVAHTYLVRNEAFGVGFTPLLAFQSPLKRCGKSTGLKCVHLMSCDARMVASITPASLFRVVDEYGGTLTVDEADNTFRDEKSDLLGIMNAGRDRMTARVMRAEAAGDGKFKIREFNTFAPIALSSIKQLPDALQDRAIVLSLKRATHGERPERLTIMVRGPLIDIGRRLARWAADLPAKPLPQPDALTGLYNRIEDKWFVLFQVAELAGGDWPQRCRKAASADLARQEANDADGGRDADLLADVWQVFYEKNKERLHTDELCEALIAMDESPWGGVNGGKGVNGYYLRTHLADFVPEDAEKIAPRKWRGDKGEARGYHEKHFEDAFSRYLGCQLPSKTRKSAADYRETDPSARARGPEHPSHPSQPSQGDNSADKSHASGATDGSTTPASHPPNPSQDDETGSHPGDASGSQPRAQPQENEVSPGVVADEEATTASSAGQIQHAPHGVQTASDGPNKDRRDEFPRGVSVRRRRPPKTEG